ncbi:MAG: hypothetical protein LKI93_04880 [Bifidobacteriaceae bacterium]|jgi:hypothetical protein|nr:hypothetical protein [Bifidobacteriaceae bacterium]MCI1914391.1 hypothetical protein [Bifidobacteriaceae bacterium]MCI1935843.1 hypothetical protein [Bifidobacteriaceae bacterium]
MNISLNLGDLATWAAAFIAVVSSGLGAWSRRRNRPQASWFFMLNNGDVEGAVDGVRRLKNAGKMSAADRVVTLINDGDGDAYDVRIWGHGCTVNLMASDPALEKSGNRDNHPAGITTHFPKIASSESRTFFIHESPDADVSWITVGWTMTPTRLGKEVFIVQDFAGKIHPQSKRPLRLPKKYRTRHRVSRLHYAVSYARRAMRDYPDKPIP